MPIYEYRCEACGADFEKLIFSADAERSLKCPNCGAPEPTRKLSLFSSSSRGGCAEGGGGFR